MLHDLSAELGSTRQMKHHCWRVLDNFDVEIRDGRRVAAKTTERSLLALARPANLGHYFTRFHIPELYQSIGRRGCGASTIWREAYVAERDCAPRPGGTDEASSFGVPNANGVFG